MVKTIGGSRKKTKHELSVPKKMKGKLKLTRLIQKLKVGDYVVLKASPSVRRGIYFRRFHGKTGVVKAVRGKCYEVKLRDGGKSKFVVVNPAHLVKQV